MTNEKSNIKSQSPNLETSDRHSNRQLTVFALPSLISGILERPAFYIVPSIYAKYFGLDLSTIGTILLMARIFDVITDPLVGYLSDRTRSPYGSRKPWLVPAVALTVTAVYFLFTPPPEVTSAYFATWFLMLFMGWTMFEIPMAAWQAELTHDYDERSRIVGFRTAFSLAGGLLFALIPLLPIFESSEINPEVLTLIAWLVVIVMPIVTIIAMIVVPRGKTPELSVNPESIFKTFRSAIGSWPMRFFLLSFVASGIGWGVLNSAIFLFIDTYLLIGDRLPWILMAISISNVVAVPIWLKLFARWQRHRCWAVGTTLAALCVLSSVFLTPGPSSFYFMFLIGTLYGLLIPSYYVAAPALIADIIDFDALRTGHNRAGQYNALHYFVMKLNNALGGAFAFWVLAFFGYQANALVHDVSEVIGLKLAMAVLPFILVSISAAIIWRFPLTERKQRVVRKRLQQLENRSSQDK